MPPTTPPAMAPALEGCFGPEDGVKEEEAGDVLVVDAVVEVEVVEVEVVNDVLEVGPDAVDSGASARSICQYEYANDTV